MTPPPDDLPPEDAPENEEPSEGAGPSDFDIIPVSIFSGGAFKCSANGPGESNNPVLLINIGDKES